MLDRIRRWFRREESDRPQGRHRRTRDPHMSPVERWLLDDYGKPTEEDDEHGDQ